MQLDRTVIPRRCAHPDFEMPSQVSPIGRMSSITNALVQAIVPCVAPSEAEVDRALTVLGMGRGEKCRCVYCGSKRTEWDHLRPLVKDRRPTGFITEIANLVPACGKCNQSKGAAKWRAWIAGSAAGAPLARGVALRSVEESIARLEAYEVALPPEWIDFAATVGEAAFAAYWEHLESISAALRRCTDEGRGLRERINRRVLAVASKL